MRALHRARLPGQGDGGLHRQGHRRADVRQGAGSTGARRLRRCRRNAAGADGEARRGTTRSADRPDEGQPTWRWSSRQGQNEIAEMADKGLDIRPHRKRMVEEDLETKFKDPDDPLPAGLRLRHVDDRLRRAELLDDLPRQADAQPHADADHRPGQPGLSRQGERPDRGLRRRLPQPGAGAGHLRRRRRRAATSRWRTRPRWWRRCGRRWQRPGACVRNKG